MIHQHIFANPRPGMSPEEFQDYWLCTHAVKYAAKIPQIRKYKIDLAIAVDGVRPLFWGAAEIWLANEQEQLASLQTPEFLEGARQDEPRWAAFWETIGLDTTAHTVLAPPHESDGVKLVCLHKRREGLPLAEFRARYLAEYAASACALPGIRAVTACTANNGLYAVGESRFDAITHLWFKDEAALMAAARAHAEADRAGIMESRYAFALAVREHWILGPAAR